MKNALIYYYKLNPDKIHQKNNNYEFEINNQKYMLTQYKRKNEELESIYKLQIYIRLYGIYCHEIILNIEKNIVTYINNAPYILLKVKESKNQITINDIMFISNITINTDQFKEITRKKWYNLWCEKNDYLEYQISQFGKKYPLIRESSDYYIGIVENCIEMLNQIKILENNFTISHDRIQKKQTKEDFYNPLNFIIDNRVRDISEYLKINIYDNTNIVEQVKHIIETYYLKEPEIQILFIRIMYPSKYMDLCEKIIDNKIEEEKIKKIINKTEIYEHNIKNIYSFLNKIIKLPEIEWLKKMG